MRVQEGRGKGEFGREQRVGTAGKVLRRAGGLFTGQRMRPIWILAGSLWLVFGVFRAGLMIACRGALAGVSEEDIARCFLVGMRFDAVPIGVMLMPLVVVLMPAPNAAFRSRWLRVPVTIYASTALLLVILVEIVGGPFFMRFDARLNWVAVDYLDSYREMISYVWNEYPVVLYLGPPIVGFFGLLWGVHKAFWSGERPAGRVWPRPLAAAGLAAVCFIMARGSLDHHPLRFGPAYFTPNRTLAQLTLNNLFTLANAIRSAEADKRMEAETFNLPSSEEARKTVAKMLRETALAEPGGTSARVPGDCNVVVILMESMGGRFVGAMGAEPSRTPFLDGLAERSLFLDRLYAVGDRTCQGIVGVLCGHPDLTVQSVMKRSRGQGRMTRLAGYFRARGYETMMFYGGNPDFDNMQGFLAPGGIEHFYGERDLSGELHMPWGFHDEVMLEKADEVMRGMGERKFFAFILTVSNHEPFTVPARTEMLPATTLEHRKINACRYSDWALGHFFEQASKSEYFKRTIFVLVADHGRMMDRKRIIDVPGYRIPCLFYGPGLVEPQRVSTVASQVDVAPTLLGLMGLPAPGEFLGRDVRRVKPGDGFAFVHEDEVLGIVRGSRLLVEFPDRSPILYRIGPNQMDPLRGAKADPGLVEEMGKEMLSYYRVAQDTYFRGARAGEEK